jgi:hypothetical protein
MSKIVLIGMILSMVGCATTTMQGNLQNDCDPGWVSPSVCLVTAHVDNKPTVQYPVSGSSILGTVAPAAATVGGAALIGSGLGRSGARVSNSSANDTTSGADSNSFSKSESESESGASSRSEANSVNFTNTDVSVSQIGQRIGH